MQSGAKSVTMGTERLERRRSAGDKQKLLVVEDDRSIAVGLEYSLGQEGFGVTLCAGVADALEALADGRPIREVVADPSAASFLECLRRRGWQVRRAENEVLSGIRTTAELLRTGRLVICPGCGDAIREFGLYRWDTSAGGRDQVCKEHDHAMDDIRYFAVTVAAKERGGSWAGSVERRIF